MNPLFQSRKSVALFLIALPLAWFAISPTARAVSPAPDGGYPNRNTAERDDALFSLTTGFGNTVIGFDALFSANGSYNTATGYRALERNTTIGNTATGADALRYNTSGTYNTATGYGALEANTTGHANTATGLRALYSNINGTGNTAHGYQTLFFNTSGTNNTASGSDALHDNTIGNDNTATGESALENNTTGSGNVALGFRAGGNLTTGSNNIDIGNEGVAGEANTIRIGTRGTQTRTYIAGIYGATAVGVPVYSDSHGQLGTVTSSARFKQDIHSMDGASEAILALKPVTFRYKQEIDPKGIRQFGLVAEEVEKVNPALVTRDGEGKPYTVRYEAVNAMLLNEFLKEHCKVKEQGAMMAELKKEIVSLTTTVREQAMQIQKVSAQVAMRGLAPQMALSSQ
jgi:hypothetical protein